MGSRHQGPAPRDSHTIIRLGANLIDILTRRVLLGNTLACAIASAQDSPEASTSPRLFTFVGGKTGPWTVIDAKPVTGDPLPIVEKLEVLHGSVSTLPEGAKWALRGVTSNERYIDRSEKAALVAKQQSIGRPEATHGALIPIRKNAAWWALTQEERRAIFETRSHHTEKGLKYLPAVARRLHHCRDLEKKEPFDFLTFFDYSQENSQAFEELVVALRESEEWKFVDREFDIRLRRDTAKT